MLDPSVRPHTSIALLRHACAGEKLPDPIADAARALDEEGRERAREIVDLVLDRLAPERLVSSPATRCVQTLLPLAEQLGRGVERDARLGTDASAEDARRCLAEQPVDAVVCTHGEVIERLFPGLSADKGGFWLLDAREGNLTPRRYVDPAVAALRSTGSHG